MHAVLLLLTVFAGSFVLGHLDRTFVQPLLRLVFGRANFFEGQFLGDRREQRSGALIALARGEPEPKMGAGEIGAGVGAPALKV